MNKRVIICLILFLSFYTKVYQQNYDFITFSVKQGLSQRYVYTINQDTNGYLWVGTGNGLSRYNGFNFKTFTTHDSLADDFITCSYRKESSIWYGHRNGCISFFNGKEFKRLDLCDKKISITDIETDYDGNIWAGTSAKGIIRVEEIQKNKNPYYLDNQLHISSFKFLPENKILIGSVNGLNFCRVDNQGRIEIIRHLNKIPQSPVVDIIERKKGKGYFVATESDGIYQLIFEDKKFRVSRVKNSEKTTGIQSIYEDSRQNLWVATFGKGLIKLDVDGTMVVFDKPAGFPTNYVKTVFEDREGNIWSGNYGSGLTRINEKSFLFFSFNTDLYGAGIHSVFARDGFRWAGTDKGLLKINELTGAVENFYTVQNGLPEDRITALFSEDETELWIGTEKNGLFRLNFLSGKINPFKTANGILENSVTCITGRAGQIWTGTKKGVCHIDLKAGTTEWFTLDKSGLPHNFVNNVYIDPQGSIWISTMGNYLSFIEKGKVGKVMITSKKPILSLGPVIADKDSGIWVGSNGGGIFYIKGKTVQNITSEDGLVSDYCYSLVQDMNDNIWVGHKGGLSRIRVSDHSVKPVQKPFNTDCRFMENAVFSDSHNRVLFGSDEGLWVYNPSTARASLPPVLHITSVTVNNDEIGLQPKITLSPGKYKIRIDFIGIHLNEPELVNYKYQMKGYDIIPEFTSQTSVVYPRLSEGRYAFSLSAVSGDGVYTANPLILDMVIKTPVWKIWWFYLFVVITLILSIVEYIRSIKRRHDREKLVLEEKVKERTREILKKNKLLQEKQEEIMMQNEELEKYRGQLEDLVDERTRELLEAKIKAEESDRLKSSFLDNLSHEIRTPLNAICGFSQILEDENLPKESRHDYIKIINESSESLLFMMDEIMDISLLRANQFIFLKEEFYIHEVLDELEYHYISHIKKDIRFELHIPAAEKKISLYTDRQRFRQILNHLLKNAAKFTEKGTITFGYDVEDEFLKFFVSDTGIGMEKEEMQKIFLPFYKIEKNSDKLYRGTGIGLSICKKIVELMGGEIWVQSEFGKGSTFYFTVPLKVKETAVKDVNPRKEHKKEFLKNLNILVAEDDAEDFRMVNVILRSYGAKIHHAQNGQDAVNHVRTNPGNNLIILMDLKMPAMDGYEATRQIKIFDRKIPVIALPSYKLKDKQKLKNLFDDYITKPVKIEALLNVLSKFLPLKY